MTHRNILIILSAASLLLAGCTGWLEQEPMSNVTTAIYYKNAEQFKNAANKIAGDCYGWARTFSSNESLSAFFDMGSDLSAHQNDVLSGINGAPDSEVYYKTPYQKLHTINDLLEQAANYEGSENIDSSVGQAYFYRAFWHFFLLKRYGGVTLSTHSLTTQSEEVFSARNSRYEVVASILEDLDKAIKLLGDSGTTKAGTSNNGEATIEAAVALKARVCLFEGTWEKYNGRGTADVTNGDGEKFGAGVAMPDGYPSANELITMARDCSAKFVTGGEYASEYSIWMPENKTGLSSYDDQENYYFFIIEDSSSNPYGLDKSSNDEAIFRTVFDYNNNFRGGQNLSHTCPGSASRKLMDMFLCTDGLPINISPEFKGYKGVNSEFENRDARMTSLFKQYGHHYWSYGGGSGYPTDYTTTPELGNGDVKYYPALTTYVASSANNGYTGRKFVYESAHPTYAESFDYIHIRLPEMLLTYAEAKYELDGSISDADLDKTVNVIRKRAKIANLTNSLVNSNGLDMLQEIRRERAIELYCEGFRLSDLCRWGIAEKELARQKCSYYVEVDGEPNELGKSQYYVASQFVGYITTAEEPQSTYTAGMPTLKPGAVILETANNRIFAKKNYVQPIPKDEIALNPNLLQNPEW